MIYKNNKIKKKYPIIKTTLINRKKFLKAYFCKRDINNSSSEKENSISYNNLTNKILKRNYSNKKALYNARYKNIISLDYTNSLMEEDKDNQMNKNNFFLSINSLENRLINFNRNSIKKVDKFQKIKTSNEMLNFEDIILNKKNIQKNLEHKEENMPLSNKKSYEIINNNRLAIDLKDSTSINKKINNDKRFDKSFKLNENYSFSKKLKNNIYNEKNHFIKGKINNNKIRENDYDSNKKAYYINKNDKIKDKTNLSKKYETKYIYLKNNKGKYNKNSKIKNANFKYFNTCQNSRLNINYNLEIKKLKSSKTISKNNNSTINKYSSKNKKSLEKIYINDLNSMEESEEDFPIPDLFQSTNTIIQLKSKKKNEFINKIKRRKYLNLKKNRQFLLSLSLLTLYKNEKIIGTIVKFCDYETLNKISLLNKKYYNYIKPLIYQKINKNIILFHNKYNNINNNIKKSVFEYTPLSKLSPIMVQKQYKDLLYELNKKNDIYIKKDLLRTAPNDSSFQYGKENYNKLYHILVAYSNYNKNIGYAQGLNFLVAHCLYIYGNEIDAFIFLDGLIGKLKLENIIGIDNSKLNNKLIEIENAVNKWCPEVKRHLQILALNYDFFICKWLITLFSNYMNIEYLFKLWDYLIIFGWKFFKGFIISVIKFNEKLILESSSETITELMNNMMKTKEFENNFINILNFSFYYINNELNIL